MSDNSTHKEVTKTKVTVDSIRESEFQKENSLTAILRQVITTKAWYQQKQIANSLTETIFSKSDFGEGFEDKPYVTPSNRVAFMLVPKDMTVEKLQELLDTKAPKGCLYRILSNRPILSDQQKYSIRIGQKTLADFANKQVVKYPKGHELEGSVITDSNAKPMYKGVYFSAEHKEDIDLRTEDPNDFYATPEILELMGMVVEHSNVSVSEELEQVIEDSEGQNA